MPCWPKRRWDSQVSAIPITITTIIQIIKMIISTPMSRHRWCPRWWWWSLRRPCTSFPPGRKTGGNYEDGRHDEHWFHYIADYDDSNINHNKSDVWSLGSSWSKSTTEGQNSHRNISLWGSNASNRWTNVLADSRASQPAQGNGEVQNITTRDLVYSVNNNEGSDNVTQLNEEDNLTRLKSNCSRNPAGKETEVKETTSPEFKRP